MRVPMQAGVVRLGADPDFAAVYDATSAPAYRLARCLSPCDRTAEQLVVRAYRRAWQEDEGEVPADQSLVVWILGHVRAAA